MAGRGEARDRQLESDVRSRLDRDDGSHIPSLARHDVSVGQGRATLTGHTRSRQVATAMVAAARRVRGLSSVEESLVADDELVRDVASAIGRTALNSGRAARGCEAVGAILTGRGGRTATPTIGGTQPLSAYRARLRRGG